MVYEESIEGLAGFVIPIIFTILGVAMTVTGMRKYLLAQKIKNTPTSKVRSAAVGLVELYGKAESKEKMLSPLSQRPCAYWKIIAEHESASKNQERTWSKFFTDESKDRFYLRDDTGKMLVEPEGADISIMHDFEFTGHMKGTTFFGLIKQKQIDSRIFDYIRENPKAKHRFENYDDKLLRVREYIVEQGSKIYLLGSAMPMEGVSGSHVAHENLIVRKGKHEKAMFISDSEEEIISLLMGITSLIPLILGLIILMISLSALVMSILGI